MTKGLTFGYSEWVLEVIMIAQTGMYQRFLSTQNCMNHEGAITRTRASTYILFCDETWVQMFNFDSNTAKTDCASIMRCTSF